MIKKYISTRLTAIQVICFLCFTLIGFGQTDICDSPPVLSIGTSCNTTNYTVPKTFGNSISGASCQTSFRDGWYTFTTGPATTNVTIDVTSNGGPKVGIAIYMGTACGSLTEIACDGQNDNDATITSAVMSNTTYKLRIMRTNNSNGNDMVGTICVYSIVPPPTNNICSGAINIGVSPTASCSTSVTGSTLGATDIDETGDCTLGAENDVWYTFQATATAHIITVTGLVGNFDPVIGALTACGSNTRPVGGECINNTNSGGSEILTLTGLTIGDSYGVQVYDFEGDQTDNGFSICVTTPPNPCSSIANIPNCGISLSVNIPAGNGIYNTGDCGFSTPGRELIGTFTPTTSGNYTIQQNSSYGFIDYFYKVAGTCSSTGWSCIDNLNGTSSSGNFALNAGTTYFFMIDAESTTGGNVRFSITCPPIPPANDLCTNATPINCTTTNLAGTTIATSNIPSVANCAFGGPSNYGVWYTFPGNGDQVTISSTSIGGFDHGIAILTGSSCGALTTIDCRDAFFGGTETSTFITTIGTTYYVYVAHYSGSSTITGDFTLSMSCVPLTPPANDVCATATPLACGDTNISGSTAFSTNTPRSVNCNMSNYGVWYTFLGTGEQTIVTADPVANFNLKISVVTGSCGSFTNVPGGCLNTGGIGVPETFSFNSVLGTTYYVYVAHQTEGSSTTGAFTISLSCCDPVIVDTPTCGIIAGELGTNGTDPAPINCTTGSCVDLEADYLKLGNSNSYRVERINFMPLPTIGLVGIRNLPDDFWSDTRSLPWDFCFYGNSYTEFVFGANGAVTFDTSLATLASGYEFDENLPSTDQALFLNTIYGVYHDIDPSVGGTIGYRTSSTPGCETFSFIWDDVPMYWDNSILYSGQIILYKDTNVIEVHIETKNIDGFNSGYNDVWNYGNAIVGLQGEPGNAITAPCRNTNDSNWTATNEAWRFVPDDGNITELKWYADTGSGFIYLPGLDNNETPNVCPTSTTTYRAEVTYTPACGSPFVRTDDILVSIGNKVWNGSVNTNWYLDSNWTPIGVPDATDCVTIPNVTVSNNRSPIADIVTAGGTIPVPPSTTALARSVTVQDNGYLTVNSNTFLEIVDWINIAPNGDVLIKDSGSLIQVNDVITNNNTGNIRIQRTVPGGVGAQNYVYWSSPVEGFAVENINMASNELRWEWNPTIDGIFNGTWIGATGVMSVGKGYIIRGLATPPSPIPANSAEFRGRPSNGIINTNITRGTYNLPAPYDAIGGGNSQATTIDDNWNLIGNPYPSAISGSAFIIENATGPIPKIDGTIYLWSHLGVPISAIDPFYGNYVYNYLGSDYVAYNGTGPNPPLFDGSIAAGQSFFVQMDDLAGINSTVTFNNNMRAGAPSNDNFLRTAERHRIWLDLITQSDVASSALVGYLQGATNAKDRIYDGYDLSETTLRFYSLIGDEEMTIQGKALPFDQDDRVPLGIVVPQQSSYKIAINSLDGLFSDITQHIYLEDTYLNIIHDLRTIPYSFTSESGKFNDRFILRYTNQTLSTPNEIANFGFNIMALNDYIKVTSGNSPINTVTVYDVLGRVLADYKGINTLEYKLGFVSQSKGTLIVKATLYNGQQQVKKVIY